MTTDDDALQDVRVVPLRELVEGSLDPDNVRRHPQRNMDAIEQSIRRFGAGRSVVIDGEGKVVAGEGALRGALEAGVEEVVLVESDGRRMVAVVRPDLRGNEARAYALTDNKTTDLSEFDWGAVAEQVVALEADGFELQPLGWEDTELEAMRLSAGLDGSIEPQPLDSQPRLDQVAGEEPDIVRCPECGHEFEA